MKVRLLGTGSSDGWPNPWCNCASCSWARDTGAVRVSTSALVDDALLLDCGPDAPRTAARLGVSLADVRWLLFGHAHPDHCAPPVLMWRGWATAGSEPLTIAGPPAALAAAKTRLADDAPVVLRELAAGEVVELGPYRVRAFAARHGGPEVGPALLYSVTGPDSSRLLYGTDTAALPDDELPVDPDGPYQLVLLEETDGDGPRSGDHLDLTGFGGVLAGLRRAGAVTDATRVVAVHLGHRNPPGGELERRLALLGAEALPDGAVVDTTARREQAPAAPRRVLILGGARSGKSAEAERRLAARPEVVYVATALDRPDDAEWTARLAAHRARRPAHWKTLETGALAPLLRSAGPPLLVDELGLWLARGEEDVDTLVEAWRSTRREVVAVSSEVGSGVVPASASGRAFRDALGALNARLAREADEVWQCVAGIACRLK